MYCRTRHFVTPEAHCFRRFFLSLFILFFTFTNCFSKESSDSLRLDIDSARSNFSTSNIVHISAGTTVYGIFYVADQNPDPLPKLKNPKKSRVAAKLAAKPSKIYKNKEPEPSFEYSARRFSNTENSATYAIGKQNCSQAVSGNSRDKISECEEISIFGINYLQIAYSNVISIYTSSARVEQKNYHSFCRPPPFQFSLNIISL